MYIIESMIDMGLNDEEWSTSDHRIVAINSCICNPRVNRMNILMHNVGIINSIPNESIKNVNFCDLLKSGCEL